MLNFDYDFRFDLRYNLSAWSALIVVLNRTTPVTARAPFTARYAKNLGIDRNEQDANSVCATSAEHQDTQHPNVLHAANAAARPTKALRASRVQNTSALIAKARSNRRDTTETTALEWKPRYATNAAKPATARTDAPFVHAVHVVFELTNHPTSAIPQQHAPVSPVFPMWLIAYCRMRVHWHMYA